MRYNKNVLTGLALSQMHYDDGGWGVLGSPWPGLVVRTNPNRTGFDVINDSNQRVIAKINMLSRGGETYTSFQCLTKPSSFQKKDLQCLPLYMDKPKSRDYTHCSLIIKNAFGSEKQTSTSCRWYGGNGTQNDYGQLENHMPHLIYKDNGMYQDPHEAILFHTSYMDGVDAYNLRGPKDFLWLHQDMSDLDVKMWCKNIADTLRKIKGCTVDIRRMVTLACTAYLQLKKQAANLPGSRLHLLPMQYANEIDNRGIRLPFKQHGEFAMAECDHYLGTLESGNRVTLPTIVLTVPRMVKDKTQISSMLFGRADAPVAFDLAYGEVVCIPPVSAANLKRRDTSSIGDDGYTRRIPNRHGRPVYSPQGLDELIATDDAKLEPSEIKDKYRSWEEPWRTCKVVKDRARLIYDWVDYRHELCDKDFLKLCKKGVADNLSYLQEQFVRSSLHDFSQDDDHVAVMSLNNSHSNALPHAVRVKDLGSDLVAETLVNQLPLA